MGEVPSLSVLKLMKQWHDTYEVKGARIELRTHTSLARAGLGAPWRR